MRNRIGNVLWGVFFLIIGVGLAGNAMDFWTFSIFFPGWWTLFIIIPCVISLVQNGYNLGSMIGLIVGVSLFLNSQSIGISTHKLLFPIIFIYIGLSFIFKKPFGMNKKFSTKDIENNPNILHNNIEYSAVFSGNNVHMNNEKFTGCNISAVFGGVDLDLRGAIIDQDVIINASAIFGGIDILVPPHVIVKVNNTPIFGGVDNKASRFAPPNGPIIYINSTCMFGGIEIK